MLKSKLSAVSYVGGVNIFDADGKLINGSAEWPAPPVTIADRSYFRTFLSDPQSPELLIEPVHSRVTGVWTTVFARKITGPNGEFLGVIGRGIEPANFEKFFASLALGDDALISMFFRDGTMLALYPHNRIDDRTKFLQRPVLPEVLSNADHGTMHLAGRSSTARIAGSARQLSGFPIVDHRDHHHHRRRWPIGASKRNT